MGFEKRGLSKIGIAIIIILVVVLAAVLIYTLSVGKEEKPSPLSEQCAFACDTDQKTSFCDVKRKVTDTSTATCNELLTNAIYSSYGVQACPGISCSAQPEGNSQVASDQTCSGLEGTWETPIAGACPSKSGFYSRTRTAEDEPPATGQICCYYYE